MTSPSNGVAQLAERLAFVGDRADVDAAVAHAVVLEIVRSRERDLRAVGREAQAAFADLGVVGQALDRAGRRFEQVQIGVEVLLRDAALVAVRRESAEADPLAVFRNREVVRGVGAAIGEPLRALGGDVERPQARDRRLGIADVDGEFLVAPGLLVVVERVGRHEIDARAVGRPLPRAHAGRVLGDLLGDRGVGNVPRQRVELFFAGLAGAEREPASVVAEREVRHALLRIRDAAGLAAVGTHHVELIARRGALRRFAIREEDEEAAVVRPPRRRLVLLLA